MSKIDRPWGYEAIIEQNRDYIIKRLFMEAGCSCQRHFHRNKRETVYILKGSLELHIKEEFIVLKSGEHYTIDPLEPHKMKGLTHCLYLKVSSAFTNDEEYLV